MAKTSIGTLVMELVSNDTKFRAGLTKAMRDAERNMKRMAAKFDRVGKHLSLKLTAPLVAMGAAGLKAFATQEKAEVRLAAALKATGQEVDGNLKRFKEVASAIQGITTVGDEASIELASLATSMGITADKLEETVRGAIGISKAFDLEMTTAIKAASAALQGKTDLLTRYIPMLSQIDDEGEKVAYVQRKMAEGFSIAEAEAKTTEGRMIQMKNAVGDLFEVIGGALAPAFTKLVDRVKLLSIQIQSINPELITMAVQVGAVVAAIGPLLILAGLVAKAIAAIIALKFAAIMIAIAGAIGLAVSQMGNYDREIISATESTRTFGTVAVEAFALVLDAVGGLVKGLKMAASSMAAILAQAAKVAALHEKTVGTVIRQSSGLRSVDALVRGQTGIPSAAERARKLMGFAEELEVVSGEELMKQLESGRAGDPFRQAMSDASAGPIPFIGPPSSASNPLLPPKGAIEEARQDFSELVETIDEVGGSARGAGADTTKLLEDVTLNAERAIPVFERLNEDVLHYAETFADRTASMLTDASGQFKSFGDVVKSVMQDIAHQLVKSGIMSILTGGKGGGGGSFGGVFGAIAGGIGSLFGGARAEGGPVAGGRSYLVGERGPELFTPRSAGNITANGAGGSVIVNQHFESGIDEGRMAGIARSIKQSTIEGVVDAVRRGGSFRLALQT